MPEELVAFLPTIDRPDFLESADRLLAERTISLAGRPPYKLPEEPTWREDPFDDPSWVYQYQALHFILDLLLAYEATGQPRYLEGVAQHLDSWLAAYLRPDFGDWGDHVMADRTRILLLAWEYLRLWSDNAETLDGVCRGLQLHAVHLIDRDEYTDHHNHGYFQDEALMALAYAFADHPRQRDWMDLALTRVSEQIVTSVSSEGVHKEHSPSYHAGMQNRFINLDILLEALDLSLPIDIDAVIAAMFDYISYAVLPTRWAPLLGDSSHWFGSTNLRGITDEALYSLSRGTAGSPNAEVDRVFFDSGYAFFRDAWHPRDTFGQTIYVAFIAAVFSRQHKHSDDLSVLVYGYGEEWLNDIGFWSYDDNDPYTHLARSSAGHNVVAIDGRDYFDQYPDERGGPGLDLLESYDLSPETSTVTGAHSFHPGVTYRRTLTYTRPASIRVEDTLIATDDQSHRYVLYWHFPPDKQVSETAPGSFQIKTENPDGPTMTLIVTGSQSPECEIIIGADDPYQGWYFDEFLQYEPAPVIACSQRAADSGFTTEIELQPGVVP